MNGYHSCIWRSSTIMILSLGTAELARLRPLQPVSPIPPVHAMSPVPPSVPRFQPGTGHTAPPFTENLHHNRRHGTQVRKMYLHMTCATLSSSPADQHMSRAALAAPFQNMHLKNTLHLRSAYAPATPPSRNRPSSRILTPHLPLVRLDKNRSETSAMLKTTPHDVGKANPAAMGPVLTSLTIAPPRLFARVFFFSRRLVRRDGGGVVMRSWRGDIHMKPRCPATENDIQHSLATATTPSLDTNILLIQLSSATNNLLSPISHKRNPPAFTFRIHPPETFNVSTPA